jgi:putative hydrolase of the HAD superfamily
VRTVPEVFLEHDPEKVHLFLKVGFTLNGSAEGVVSEEKGVGCSHCIAPSRILVNRWSGVRYAWHMIAVVGSEALPSVVGVVFDGDDTLWSTEFLYDEARNAARRIVANAGMDGAAWEGLERRIDVQNVATMGFSTKRFPRSCVQAYEQLCVERSAFPEPAVSLEIQAAARSVFERDAPLVANARKALTDLRDKGRRLALLTKGDHEMQVRRIETSGLQDLFEVIEIVPEKSPAVIRSVVERLGVGVRNAWMVGNSVPSDLIPALEAGLRAVWIDAHVWEYERDGSHTVEGPWTALSTLTDLGSVIHGE